MTHERADADEVDHVERLSECGAARQAIGGAVVEAEQLADLGGLAVAAAEAEQFAALETRLQIAAAMLPEKGHF